MYDYVAQLYLGKLLLTIRQLSTTREVNSEECHNAVDDQELEDVRLFVKLGRNEVQQLHLLLRGVGSSVQNVVEDSFLEIAH